MSDNEAEHDEHVDDLKDDNNAHQACYVFKPFSTDDLDQEKPAQKRRKTKPSPEESLSTFPLLDHGAESVELAQLRHDTFQRVWDKQKARFEKIVDNADETASEEVFQFIQSPANGKSGKLKTGLIVSGSDSSAQSRLLERWRTNSMDAASEVVVQLRASHCVNLQTTLRNIIKTTISSQVGQDGYQEFLNKHKRLIPMNFDLELLQVFVEEYEIHKIILSVLDVETFNIGILSELFSLLSAWSESIPFIALLGIATTVELFESRLPKSTVGSLDATSFTLQASDTVVTQILQDLQNDSETSIQFGPSTITALEDLTRNQGVTVDEFISAIKYCIMSHFFANSISVLLSESDTDNLAANKSLCQAIRNTDSFQRHCEDLLRTTNKSHAKEVSQLLTDDKKLVGLSLAAIKQRNPTTVKSSPVFSLPEATSITSRLLTSFTPRPRHALERALSRPGDYLGCECCTSSTTSSSSSSTPPTSILYTLLQEAGTVINVRDLYDAFCARAFPDNNEDENGDGGDRADRQQLSIFYTSLAELRMLGLVKSSTSAVIKKKAVAAAGGGGPGNGVDGSVLGIGRGRDRYGDVDFVAKTGWAGL